MSDFKNVTAFKLDYNGVRDNILKSDGVAAACLEAAEAIAANANGLSEIDGAEYVAIQKDQYKTRRGAIVAPDTEEAYKDNLEHNTLEKALRT